ncbi:hypothetical protein DL96DRAFT_871015 [Flagelloscypha sp. PMI_526]|nr:hypothetical protein DL96DRAFT_871015 [Flagelloscypha sp. PMI_526]
MLALWLDRSQNCLLDIHVLLGVHLSLTSPLLTALIFHSRRWETIRLQLSDNSSSHEVSQKMDDPDIVLPHLRAAHFIKMYRVPRCFKKAPLLRHLDIRLLEGAYGIFKSLSGGFRNLQILSIEQGRATEVDVLDCLTIHPQLLSFIAGMTPHEIVRPTLVTMSVIPELVYLELRFSCRVLQNLQCPSLHSLHLTIDGSSQAGQLIDGLEDLPMFLSRSPCLKLLILYPANNLSWMWNPHLSGSVLEHLQLGFLDCSHDLSLHTISESAVYLPCLTTMSLSFRSAVWEDMHLRTVQGVLGYLPKKESSSRLNEFPSLEKINVRISLWGQNVRNEDAIVWIEKWRELKKSVLPGALSLTLALPREGQGGFDVFDLDAWYDRLKVEESLKGLRKVWIGLISRFH